MRLKPPHLALALAALIALPLAAGETKGKTAEKPSAPAAEASLKVYVDPATGQIVSPKSDPGASKAPLAAAAAQSAQPLRVEKVTTKAGGRKVNLQDRFMMDATVTVDAKGKVSQSCEQAPAAGPKTTAPGTEDHHDR